MHKNELWQLFSANGEPIPCEGWDSALDNPTVEDKIVGIVVVFLYRLNNDGELEFLWQRRSDKVGHHAGEYDFSAGGHVNFGESLSEAAVREAREEIGANISAEDLNFVTMCAHAVNRFGWVYMVDWTGRGDDFAFDDGEVSEVKWVPYAEMEKFRKKYAKEPLKKDDFTFMAIENWLKMREKE
ncbi:NUDIX hydrolase [Candidatus Saccharibacteria bacterium]|nr:NUDIX hydrolase [Candidatus Saccharibacteria bacterium]